MVVGSSEAWVIVQPRPLGAVHAGLPVTRSIATTSTGPLPGRSLSPAGARMARPRSMSGHWPAYQDAYEEAIRNTASKHAPWYVVPADNKWFTRLVVAAAIVQAMSDLKLHYPVIGPAQRKELAAARAKLARE